MSASDKKKLRKEENMAKLTKRQEAEQQEAKKLKVNTTVFLAVVSLVLCIGIGLIAYNWYASTGLSERYTTAVQIGEHKLSVAELNYYYVDSLNQLTQNWYDMYLLQINDGFKASLALDQQQYKDQVGMTWGDHFVDEAVKQAAGVLAVCDEAKNNGYTLKDSDRTEIDETLLALKTEARLYGYTNFTDYLKAVYGKGSTEKTFQTYLENRILAQSYYNNYSDSLTYSAEKIAEKDAEVPGSYSNFTYTYYTVDPHDFLEHASEDSHEHSEEDLAAALAQAKAIAEELVASGATNKEELDAAIANLEMYKTEQTIEDVTEETAEETTEESTEDAADSETPAEETTEDDEEETEEESEQAPSVPTSTKEEDAAYDSIPSAIVKWMTEEGREAGKVGYIPYYVTNDEGEDTEEVEGYYVVILDEEDKHETNLVTVRHILIKYKGGTTDADTGDTVYSETEKQAARDEAAKIQAEFESGEKTSERFGELAKTYSADNADEGGLYEDIYPGWAEENFDAWCFQSNRAAGDVGIVETKYGVHLIYFVETQETTYREYMITTEMRSADTEAWYTGLEDSYYASTVVKNTSMINTSITLNSSISFG